MRPFDPRISGWHPGSVSCAGESECHRAGANLPGPLPLSGDISLPPPPILHLYLSQGVGHFCGDPQVPFPPTSSSHQGRVCLMIFSMFYDLNGPEKVRGSAGVVCRLFVRSPTPSRSTCPASWQLYGNVSKCPPQLAPDTPQHCPTVHPGKTQQKMGGPTGPARTF